MKDSKGFTLVELIAVIAILAILAGIAVPAVVLTIENSKQDVCKANIAEVERMYEVHLNIEGIDHSDMRFQRRLNAYEREVCPSHGEIYYEDGEVHCSKHPKEDNREAEDEGEDEGGSSVFIGSTYFVKETSVGDSGSKIYIK